MKPVARRWLNWFSEAVTYLGNPAGYPPDVVGRECRAIGMSLHQGMEATGGDAIPRGQRKDLASALTSVAVSEADRDLGAG